MTLADALAAVARLCPPDVHATLVAAVRRPVAGHQIGELALRRGGVTEEQSARPDPRAEPLPPDVLATALQDRIAPTSGRLLSASPVRDEASEEPTRRERRPSSTSQQIAAVTSKSSDRLEAVRVSLERSNDALAASLGDALHTPEQIEAMAHRIERLVRARLGCPVPDCGAYHVDGSRACVSADAEVQRKALAERKP